MKKILWAIFLVAALLICAAPVSATDIPLDIVESSSISYSTTIGTSTEGSLVDRLEVYHIQDWAGLNTIYLSGDIVSSYFTGDIPASDSIPVTLSVGATTVGTGEASYNVLFDSEGVPTGLQRWIELDYFESGALIGDQVVMLTPGAGDTLWNGLRSKISSVNTPTSDRPILMIPGVYGGSQSSGGYYIVRKSVNWHNLVTITDTNFILNREIGGETYSSTLVFNSGSVSETDTAATDVTIPYVSAGNWTVTAPTGQVFSGTFGGSSATSAYFALTLSPTTAAVGDPITATLTPSADAPEWDEVCYQHLGLGGREEIGYLHNATGWWTTDYSYPLVYTASPEAV